MPFDVLMDKIRPAVFVVGDDRKKGQEREVKALKSQDVIFQLFVGWTSLGRLPQNLACMLHLTT